VWLCGCVAVCVCVCVCVCVFVCCVLLLRQTSLADNLCTKCKRFGSQPLQSR
jgi:hypothetical protein